MIPYFWFQELKSSSKGPDREPEFDGEICPQFRAVIADGFLVEWPSTHAEDSDSTAPPLLQELLFIEQNVRRAVATGKPETNNWPPHATRADLVYEAWLAAGRLSASEILAAAEGRIPEPPPLKLSSPLPSSPIPPHSVVYHEDPENLSDKHAPPIEVDGVASDNADEPEDEILAQLEQTILEAEKCIASYTELAANESKESSKILKGLIKKKEKEIAEAQKKMAAMSGAPRAKRYSRFTEEKRQRALAVIEAARKAVHDFAVEENIDPTLVQRLLQGKLLTGVKNSAWDAWEGLMAIARQSGGAHQVVFYLEHTLTIRFVEVNLEGILPPDKAREAMLSSKDEATTTRDSRYYKLAFDIAGVEGQRNLKRLIIERSQEATTKTLKTGALDDTRAKTMASIHRELHAFVCIKHRIQCKDNLANTAP